MNKRAFISPIRVLEDVNTKNIILDSDMITSEQSQKIDNCQLRACLYGLGYPRQPSPRDNFTKRLYENCVTETQLTLLNYAYILKCH